MRRGEIIAVGSELLLGGRRDTNSLVLSARLAALGVEVRFKSIVGDHLGDLTAALRIAAGRADVVLLTGGLGPTRDDCTRQAVARVTRRPLRRRREALEGMRRRLAAWGRAPSPAQLRQALIPQGAEVLSNPVGSAPGFCLRWRRCLLLALPGVPEEAERMFALHVAPRLEAGRRTWIEQRRLHTFGLPEAEVEARIAPLVRGHAQVRLGLLASPLGVTISLTAELGASPAAGRRRDTLLALERQVRRRLARWIYVDGERSMEQVVGEQLAARRLWLSVAESCTGGLIGHRLTEVPGSSGYLERVVVSYSNRAKVEMLGVPEDLLRAHGAVSAPVAAAMARGVRERSGADVGLSVTGIAGPGGGTEKKPVGLVYIGLDAGRPGRAARAPQVQEFRFHGSRQAIKLRASQAALDLLRRWLEAGGARRGP